MPVTHNGWQAFTSSRNSTVRDSKGPCALLHAIDPFHPRNICVVRRLFIVCMALSHICRLCRVGSVAAKGAIAPDAAGVVRSLVTVAASLHSSEPVSLVVIERESSRVLISNAGDVAVAVLRQGAA